MPWLSPGDEPSLPARDVAMPAIDFSTQVIKFVRESISKERLVLGYLHFSQQLFQTVTLFAVHRFGTVQCLGAAGPNASALVNSADIMPLEMPTLLRRCLIGLSPYRGPIPHGHEDKRMFLQVLNELPDECWLYPAAIGDFPDTLFYAERPIGGATDAQDKLEFLIGKIILGLRRLVIEQLLVQNV